MDNTELRLMREQITSDFQMTWKMMGSTADSVETLRKAVDQGFADVAERLRQVEGRMRLTEQRFDAMLQAVENLERRPPAA